MIAFLLKDRGLACGDLPLGRVSGAAVRSKQSWSEALSWAEVTNVPRQQTEQGDNKWICAHEIQLCAIGVGA
jgi:hypothetical protein